MSHYKRSNTDEEGNKKKPIICKTSRPAKMILARETGPGPGAYKLPHSFCYRKGVKKRLSSPAYTIKGRNRFNFKPYGPGPGAYDLPIGMTRTGLEIGREFTIGPKLPPPKNYNPTPAPIYYPKAISCKKKSPMGQKIKPLSAKPSPAPNAYTLPSTLRKNKFRFKGRVKFGSYVIKSITPGPRALPDMELWKENPPQTIIGIRPPLSNKTAGPGPAGYRATKVNTVQSKAPSYYFGCRHSTFVTPFYLKTE